MSVPSILLDQVLTRKLFAFAGTSLLIYDYLITLSLEVAYIWDAPWTFVKTLFLINRYGNLIGQTFLMLEETGHLSHNSQKFCIAFGLYCAIFAVFSGETIRLLVVMRACAILGCTRSITMFSCALYVLCALGILVGSTYWVGHVGSSEFEYLSEIGVCFAPLSFNVWMLWIIPLLLDNLVLAIVTCSLCRVTRWSRDYHPSRLIRLLARDALLFYSAAMFNAIFFIVSWNVYRLDPRNNVATLLSFALLSVVGQRLVLNLRRLRTHPESTHDLSRELQRQMEVMGAVGSVQPIDADVELEELGGSHRVRRVGGLVFAVATQSRSEDPEVLLARSQL